MISVIDILCLDTACARLKKKDIINIVLGNINIGKKKKKVILNKPLLFIGK